MRIVLSDEPLIDGPTALRPWRDSDIGPLASVARDPLISHWTRVPEDYDETHARSFLLQRYDFLLAGTMAPFAIVSAADGALLGSISLIHIQALQRSGEVGYWLAAEARGQGHATRAVRLICAWGMRTLGLERIGLLAATGNVASQAVAERSGFTREAVLRSYLATRRGRQDMVVFGLLADDPVIPLRSGPPPESRAPTRASPHPSGRA